MWNPLKSFALLAGRLRKQPMRSSEVYPRLMSIGGHRRDNKRPIVKATPANLRQFSRTVFARRAINKIKNSISLLGWEIVPLPGVAMSKELERQIETATFCFDHPNADDSFMTLTEQVIEDYLVVGAAAIEQQTGGDELRPLWMWPVDGQSIQIFPAWSGKPDEARYLQILSQGGIGVTAGTPLMNSELIYIRPNPSTSTPYGYGPLEIAFKTVSRLLGVGDFAGNVATNAEPGNILLFPNADPTWIATFRQYWRDEIEGQGKSPIVGGDKDAKAIKLHTANDDALYLKYQEFLIREIATAFDVSPQSLGLERDVNRSTSEVAEDRDWNESAMPVARKIESHLTREALHAKLGFYQLQFRYIGLHREDELQQAEIYEIYYKSNAITPNEQREKMGKPPLEGNVGDMTAADVGAAQAEAGAEPKASRKGKPAKKAGSKPSDED